MNENHRTYPGRPSQVSTDLSYAISVLLAAGAVVEHRGDRIDQDTRSRVAAHAARVDFADATYWAVTPRDRSTSIVVSGLAMLELAHTEARKRRDQWQQTMDQCQQLAMFEHEDTTRYEVR